MAEIRALERDDLAAVNALMRAHLGGWEDAPRLLEQTLLDHPWVDPETPSLVAEEDGRVVGFIGAQPRRLRLEDRVVRGVCCSHLVVDPSSRGQAVGALLLGDLLKGAQDLTWSDSADDVVARMWTTFGGRIDHARAYDWLYVLRPAAWVGQTMAAAARRRFGREAFPVGGLPVHALGGRLIPRAHPGVPEGVSGVDAAPGAIAEVLEASARKVKLRVDYDEAALAYTLGLVETQMDGCVTRIVRIRDRAIGWYAYLLRPSGASRVLHIAAPLPAVEAVFAELAEHARAHSSAALTGRFEPHLEAPLRLRIAVLGFARRPILHSHDPEVDRLLPTAASLLTRLDGEWYVT